MVDPSKEFAFGDPLVHILADWTGVTIPTSTSAATRSTAASSRGPPRMNASRCRRTSRRASSRQGLQVGREGAAPAVPAAGDRTDRLARSEGPDRQRVQLRVEAGLVPALSRLRSCFFNEQEDAEQPTFDAPPFPGVTQRVTVASADLPVTFYSGLRSPQSEHRRRWAGSGRRSLDPVDGAGLGHGAASRAAGPQRRALRSGLPGHSARFGAHPVARHPIILNARSLSRGLTIMRGTMRFRRTLSSCGGAGGPDCGPGPGAVASLRSEPAVDRRRSAGGDAAAALLRSRPGESRPAPTRSSR